MNGLIIALWILIFVVFYAYLGYGIVLYCMVKVKRIFKGKKSARPTNAGYEPEVTLFVAAYNEIV